MKQKFMPLQVTTGPGSEAESLSDPEAIRAGLEPPDPGAFGPDAAPGEAAFAGEPACRESRRSSSPSPSSDLLFLH